MAETKEEVIIKIDLEQEDADFTKLANLKEILRGLKNEQNALKEALKAGAITQKEYNQEIVRVEALQKKAQAQYNQTQRAVTGLKNPIAELNENVQKQNQLLGGAIPALDKLTGGAASAAQGIYGMVKASIAFIATPIGAVIAALGLGIAALTAYFKGSEEGQDRLTRITTILTVALNQLKLVVESIGESIFEAGNSFTTATEKLGAFGIALDISLAPLKLFLAGLKAIVEFTATKLGLDPVIDAIIATSDVITELNDKIEADENAFIVRRAKVNTEVLKLREEAIKQEGDLKEATISQAIKLEKDLAAAEKAHLEDKLKAFDLEAATTGALTEEQKKQRAELLAAIINAEAAGAQATIKFQKELERLRDEAFKKEQKRIADEIKLIEDLAKAEQTQLQNNVDFLNLKTEERLLATKNAYEIGLIDKEQFDEQFYELQLQGLEAQKELLIANGEETLEIDNAIVDLKIKNAQREKDAKAKLLAEQIKLEEAKEKGLMASAKAGLNFAKEIFGENKAIASAEAIINTIAGATRALKDFPAPYSYIVAALVSLTGLANVAKINATGFARGGFTGKGGVWEPAGIVHKGEVVWSQADVAAAGGADRVDRMRPTYRRDLKPYATGGIVGSETRIATQQAVSQFDANQMAQLLNQVQTVLVLEEFQAKQNSVSSINRRATVIG